MGQGLSKAVKVVQQVATTVVTAPVDPRTDQRGIRTGHGVASGFSASQFGSAVRTTDVLDDSWHFVADNNGRLGAALRAGGLPDRMDHPLSPSELSRLREARYQDNLILIPLLTGPVGAGAAGGLAVFEAAKDGALIGALGGPGCAAIGALLGAAAGAGLTYLVFAAKNGEFDHP